MMAKEMPIIIRNLDDGFSRLIERQSELKDDEQYKLVKMYTEYGKALDAAIKWLKVRRRFFLWIQQGDRPRGMAC